MMTKRHNLSLLLCLIISMICSACNQKPSEVQSLKFKLYYQNQLLNCQKLKTLPIKLNELRFYLHDLQANSLPLQLAQNNQQHQSLAYLDFSSTLRHCDAELDLLPNEEILFLSNNPDISQLSFKLGVPLALNHQNPVKAMPPLNRSDMHWQWLSGYKFLRLEYMKDEELNRFHLGSIGCKGKLPDAVKCQQENRLPIELNDINSQSMTIGVHIDALLKPQTASLCMGNANDVQCKTWIEALEKSVFKVDVL